MGTAIGSLVFILESIVMNSMGVWCNHLAMVGHDFAHSIICAYHRDILGLNTCIEELALKTTPIMRKLF